MRAADNQGPLQYPVGVGIEVLQDSLGIYEDHKEIFWAISPNADFETTQLITYPAFMNR